MKRKRVKKKVANQSLPVSWGKVITICPDDDIEYLSQNYTSVKNIVDQRNSLLEDFEALISENVSLTKRIRKIESNLMKKTKKEK